VSYFSFRNALAFTLILALLTIALAYGQTSSTNLFGCQQYGDTIHCDRLLNKMEGYQADGNSTLINALTSGDTLFVNGRSGQALEMRGEFTESIEIMNLPELNPKQFSVSFWMMPAAVSNPMHGRLSHQNTRIITYAIGSRFAGSDEPKINDGRLIVATREVL
jgi:hypothetical protein